MRRIFSESCYQILDFFYRRCTWQYFFLSQIFLSYSKSLLTELSAKSTIRKVFDFRSSHQRCSLKKGALRNFTKFTGKHLCQSLFFNKVAGLKPETLLKNRPWHKWFPINFMKFLRTTFFTEHLRWLLLFFHLTQRKLLSFRCGKKNVMWISVML